MHAFQWLSADMSRNERATGRRAASRFHQWMPHAHLRAVVQVAVKRGHDEQAYSKGVRTLEAILGVFTPDMSVMKESEWVWTLARLLYRPIP